MTAKAVALTMSSNSCQQIEEIPNDLDTSIRLYADGNEGREGIPGELRFCANEVSTDLEQVVRAPTSFAGSEHLIRFPCNNASRESAPTPLDDARKDLVPHVNSVQAFASTIIPLRQPSSIPSTVSYLAEHLGQEVGRNSCGRCCELRLCLSMAGKVTVGMVYRVLFET